MGLTEKRNEVIAGINLLMRRNMDEGERRKGIYKLLKQHESYVIDCAVENAVNKMREGVE